MNGFARYECMGLLIQGRALLKREVREAYCKWHNRLFIGLQWPVERCHAARRQEDGVSAFDEAAGS